VLQTGDQRVPHPRSIEGVTTYAKKRGSEVSMKAAEAFMVPRDLQW
jgi:hypothetical protein